MREYTFGGVSLSELDKALAGEATDKDDEEDDEAPLARPRRAPRPRSERRKPTTLKVTSPDPPAAKDEKPAREPKRKNWSKVYPKGSKQINDLVKIHTAKGGEVQISRYVKEKLDAVDAIIFTDGSPIGPAAVAEALARLCGGKEQAAQQIAQDLWDLASGKPCKYAPKRAIRPMERMKAIALLHMMSGAAAEVKHLEPQGSVARACESVAEVARRAIERSRLRDATPKVIDVGGVHGHS